MNKATWKKIGNYLENEEIRRFGDCFECSECGHKIFAIKIGKEYLTSEYCPNCRAVMELSP